MRINKNGFIFRTAYAFENPSTWPTGHVNGCNLLWRFIWHGFWKTILNIGIFFVVVILFGVIGLPVRFLCALSIGRGLKPGKQWSWGNDPPFYWGWVDSVASRVFIGAYHSYKIENWPRAWGFRLLPGAVLLTGGLIYLQFLLIRGAVADWGLIDANSESSPFIVIVGMEIAGLAVSTIGISAAWLSNTELGQLIRLRVKAFKEQTCPVVEIVG